MQLYSASAYYHSLLQCGTVDTVRIIVNRAGKSKGYAYVEFHDKVSHLYFFCWFLFASYDCTIGSVMFFSILKVYGAIVESKRGFVFSKGNRVIKLEEMSHF